MGEEEELEDEMSAMGGMKRPSDAMMQTPFRSQNDFKNY
jgi:hypothetical protein